MNGLGAYAGNMPNPSLLLAVETTRRGLQGLMDGTQANSWQLHGMPQAPAALFHPDYLKPGTLDRPERLSDWGGEPRGTVLVFEMLSGLSFSVTEDDDPAKGGCALWYGTSELIRMVRPSLEVLREQSNAVVQMAAERLFPKSDDLATNNRLNEIAAQVTPPITFWTSLLPMQPERMKNTLELIELTLTLAAFAEQRFKHALAVPRPQHVHPAVVPAILTPGHASLPSGHATEVFATAHILLGLLGANRDTTPDAAHGLEKTLLGLASRVALNRQVAGVHYAIDSLAGRLLGRGLANYLMARCTGAPLVSGSVFDANASDSGAAVMDVEGTGLLLGTAPGQLCRWGTPGQPTTPNRQLNWLWNQARAEWGLPPVSLADIAAAATQKA